MYPSSTQTGQGMARRYVNLDPEYSREQAECLRRQLWEQLIRWLRGQAPANGASGAK